MKLRKNNILHSLLILLPIIGISQEQKIDGVAAVIGNEVVLESDIQRDYMLSQQQGMDVPDQCAFVNNILIQKMVLTHAKQDTLVAVSTERVKERARLIIEDFKSRGSEDEILSVYGVRTMAELQNELEIIVTENQLVQGKRDLIESGTDASPEDVKMFFEKYKDELPNVNEEVELSHIVMFPVITESHKQEIIDQLNGIKKEIEEGASFSTKAILFSEDPGSSNNGGLYENIRRGTFVPEFDAVAFNLDEGEISDPIESKFGFHLIQLDKRLGQSIDVRHILIIPKPTDEEMRVARNLMDSIRTEIIDGNMTFKEAALKYSVDKYTRYNAGKLTSEQTGENKFERSRLPMKHVYAIAGLESGDIAEPFETEFENRKALELLRLDMVVPAHKISLDTDYTRLQNMTIQHKSQEKLFEWIDSQMSDTFIKIHEDYQDCEYEFNWLKK